MKAKAKVPQKSSRKGGETATPSPSAPVNGSVLPSISDVCTIRETAEFLRVEEEVVQRLADAEALPGRRVGDQWRFLKSALCEWLRTPEVNPDPNDWRERNKRILALAGSMADDDTIRD